MVVEHHRRISQAFQLPTFKALGLYPYQREVAVKGALFPHYILGIELPDTNKFFINSHIINIGNQEYDFLQVAKDGIPIDQSTFSSHIFDTGYIRWAETDLRGNFNQFNV